LLNTEKGYQGVPSNDEGNQGEYNETFKFYKHPELPEGVFMKETYQSNSYGYEENLVELKFVQGKAKTITVYEPI
jgi:hypothetical protein